MQENLKPPRRVRVERGIYRNPSTGGFEIQYTDSSGRVRWQRVPGGLRDARTARAEVQARLGRGELVTAARRTFADVGEEWLAAQTHLRRRTHQHYTTALRRHLLPRIGEKRIGEVNEDVIARVIVELQEEGLSGWTIRGLLVPLGRILAYATRRRMIPSSPLARLERRERPRVVRREMRVLRSDEIAALLDAAPVPYRPILATAVFTGLRQSELLGLCWADVDFDNGVVHVRRQLDRNGTYAEPKTQQAYRSVVLMPSLAALLRAHKASSTCTGPTDPVFATQRGRPMYFRNVTRRGLAVAIEKVGLQREGEPRLRFHDLRHTFASLLIAQGLNVVFISRQMGHSSPSFTLDVYGGLFDRAEHARRASESLEAAFGDMLTTEAAKSGDATEPARGSANGANSVMVVS